MDKRVVSLALIFALILVGCVQKVQVSEKETQGLEIQNRVQDCQCHEKAYKYPYHVNGTNYCLDCHKIEEHPKMSEYSDLKDCSKCHENSLFRIHMPNHSCVECHGDAKSIHQKFESKFLEEEK
ncbi:MAG: cytochrome c3 family protein [Archaeoglobus sp.]|nr:cytochrome c3 family protein [Archaeoglobus sp.]